jgi:hypothetical protein
VTFKVTALDAHDKAVKGAKLKLAVRTLKGPHGGKLSLHKVGKFKNGTATVVLEASEAGKYTFRLSGGVYVGQSTISVG